MTLSNARKRDEASKAEKSFAPPEPDRELDALIQFWKDSLSERWTNEGRLVMSPSTVDLVNQTIKRLEELKEIKEGEIVELNEDQASLFKEGD